jgi:hypothetical protein
MASGNKLLSGKIEFIQYHKPGLLSGDYEVTVEQKVSANEKIDASFKNTREFTIAGPRFQLTPQDIYAVFPPPGSLGEHSNVLPHVIFNRSTLPWEREIWSDSQSSQNTGTGSNAPWLALLVFHQDDIENGRVSQPKVVKLSDLQNHQGLWHLDENLMDLQDSEPVAHNSSMPSFAIGSDQHTDDKVTVIDVDQTLLEKILPGPAELDYLAHVRQRKTLSVDIEAQYEAILRERCKDKETKTATKVFDKKTYEEFRKALKHGGIRLSPRAFCSITARKNGNRMEWVVTNTDDKKQFVARADRDEAVDEVLNVFTNDAEVAIIVANRLPKTNGLTAVHLVSLEDRYNANSEFQYGGKAQFARLVSLKQWSFSCTRPDRTFKEIVKALDRDTLRLKFFEWASEHAGILEKGYVPLRHYLRKGDKTVSWYHSPLLPWRNTERLYELKDPAKKVALGDLASSPSEHGGWSFDKDGSQCWTDRKARKKFKVTPCFGSHPRVSDQLLRLNQKSGVFDTTYAAAWKLGRLMALEDKRFSVALTNWKRTCAQHAHRTRQSASDLHLHADEHPALVSSLAPPPPEVSTWFDQSNVLKGVPFNYLVPDSRMLPEESIRFFEVDPLWVDCLLDGAFSLGRVTEVDHQQDFQHIIADNRYPRMSGLLIRSEAVSGWPGMLVDAFCKLPSTVELFGDDNDKVSTPEDKPRLRKALEAIGLPLPKEFSVKISAAHESCTLNDLDTNPQYVDTVLGEDTDPPDPQLCLMMPDRDRQYHYTIIKEGEEGSKELYLKLPLLRQERLGNGVLLCLFQGAVQRIDVHLKPEALHFGFKREDGNLWALATAAGNGTALLNADGTYTYTPNAKYHGPDSFTYTITNADKHVETATVKINVTPEGNLPVDVEELDTLVVAEDSGTIAGNLAFLKELKRENGEESGKMLKGINIPWKTPVSETLGGGTLKLKELAQKIKTTAELKEEITSARFALQMIEGNELVRFVVEGKEFDQKADV